MSNFLQTIFTKIVAAISSVFIAAGLISAPAIAPEHLQSEPQAIVQEAPETEMLNEVISTETSETEDAEKAEEARSQEAQRQKELAAQKAAEEQLKKEQEARALVEQQRLEQERQEVARIEAEQNTLLKIERCKTEARKNITNFLEAGKLAIDEGMAGCVQKQMSSLSGYFDGGAMSPETLSSMGNLARSSCQRIANNALNKLESQSEDIYSRQYLDCLNK